MTCLLQTIYTYRAQWNAYLAATLDDDNAAPDLSRPTLQVLEAWDTPATGLAEAAEAAKLALEFYEIGSSEVIPAMMRAVVGFLDRGSRVHGAPPGGGNILADAGGHVLENSKRRTAQ